MNPMTTFFKLYLDMSAMTVPAQKTPLILKKKCSHKNIQHTQKKEPLGIKIVISYLQSCMNLAVLSCPRVQNGTAMIDVHCTYS